jgi:2-methylisocitrate lyase-like PEP mutase family enzyme
VKPSTADFERFKALHCPGEPLFLPNAWDFASAVALARAGYQAIGTTSCGVAMVAGVPDATGAALEATLATARQLARLPMLLTVDFEGGFAADPAAAAELAAEVHEIGAVGINVEDGLPDGSLAPADHHAAKVAAIKDRSPELFVNARTDAYWLGEPADPAAFERALERALAYQRAGADGVFIPAVPTLQEISALTARIDAPLNVLYLPGRHTFAQLGAAGAARMSTGSWLFRVALGAALDAAKGAREGAAVSTEGVPSYAATQDWLRPPS